MRVSASYDIRGVRVSRYWSVPQPTLYDLTKIIHGLAWVAGQQNPKVTINEG